MQERKDVIEGKATCRLYFFSFYSVQLANDLPTEKGGGNPIPETSGSKNRELQTAEAKF